MFRSSIQYFDRKSRIDYFFDKYKSILNESVLDVGADAQYLKPKILENGGSYKGMGYGENIDVHFNLEECPYPFKDKEFETVICLDVLEHLENVHQVFREVCRIANRHIIISLPNPWAEFFQVLRKGDYSDDIKLKFYGLPVDRPTDRHRWFFSEKEAVRFVDENARKEGWSVRQVDSIGDGRKMGGNGVRGWLARFLLTRLFRSDIDQIGLHHGTIWFVLEKKAS